MRNAHRHNPALSIVDITQRDSQVSHSISRIVETNTNYNICPPVPFNRISSKYGRIINGVRRFAFYLTFSALGSLRFRNLSYVINYNDTRPLLDILFLLSLGIHSRHSRVLIIRHQERPKWPLLFRFACNLNRYSIVVDLSKPKVHPPVCLDISFSSLDKCFVDLKKSRTDKPFLVVPHTLHEKYLSPQVLAVILTLAERIQLVIFGPPPSNLLYPLLKHHNIAFNASYSYTLLLAYALQARAVLYLCNGPTTSGSMHTLASVPVRQFYLAEYQGAIPRFLDSTILHLDSMGSYNLDALLDMFAKNANADICIDDTSLQQSRINSLFEHQAAREVAWFAEVLLPILSHPA
jgi:hypothetical protein